MNWYVKRMFQSLFTIVAVVTLSFAIIRLMPGGPMDFLRARLMEQNTGMSQEEVNGIVEAYTNVQPDEPLWVQYVDYFSSLATGDLGTSLWYNEPVAEILGGALPWTAFYMSIALFLMFGIGILLGAVMGYKEGSRFDFSMTVASTVLNSIPYYVAAIMLVYVFGYQFGVFPTGGRYASGVDMGFTLEFVGSAVMHAALPIISLVVTEFGFQALSMRGNSIRVLGEDYLRVARLRGLAENRIAIRYVGRNAVLPMYTQFMIAVGFMFGGSVILEEIFSYPGVGYYIYGSVQSRDYPVMMGGFIIITIAVVLGILIADLTYGKLDPRAGSADTSKRVYGGNISIHQLVRKVETWARSLTEHTVASGGGASAAGGRERDLEAIQRYASDTDASTSEDESPALVTSRRERFRLFLEESVLTPLRIVWSDWRARLGSAIIALYVLMGLVAWIPSTNFWPFNGVTIVQQPSTQNEILMPPFQSMAHPLGTDGIGQGIFNSIVHATPAMLEMIVAGAVFTTVVATVVGTVSGYMGGRVDSILMTITDVMMTIPGLPFVIVLAVILEPRQEWLVGIVISINAWAGLARSLRSQVLTLRDMEYVEASRTMSIDTHEILSNDLVPNLMPYIFVNFVNSARNVIFASVGLYFLGILPVTSPNWGVMMDRAYSGGGALYTWETAHWLAFPMLTIILLSFGLILFAQGTDRVFNPRVRARHAKTVETEDIDDSDASSPGTEMVR